MGSRYKGKTGSLTREQLQNMGCIGKTANNPQILVAPPPTYAALINVPISIEICAKVEYKASYKQKFINKMRISPFRLKLKDKSRIHDQNINVTECNSASAKAPYFNARLLPTELQIIHKKQKCQLKTVSNKNSGTLNIVNRLELLEEKDNTDDKLASNKSDTSSEIICDDDDVAEEVDEENDYENSYFDNGEAYNEEDDNIDDGPVY